MADKTNRSGRGVFTLCGNVDYRHSDCGGEEYIAGLGGIIFPLGITRDRTGGILSVGGKLESMIIFRRDKSKEDKILHFYVNLLDSSYVIRDPI